MKPLLSIQNLHVATGKQKILTGLNLELAPGAIEVIMGPNGSGKSTLCQTLLGHPDYQVSQGTISWRGKDITRLATDKRARLGMFLSFQYPREIPGVSLAQLTRLAYTTRQAATGEQPSSPSEFLVELRSHLQKSGLAEQFLERSLNEGASGGEKKRLEMVQLGVLAPRLAILDEIDSGLDIDALKNIATQIKEYRQKYDTTFLVITHYQRLLHYIEPDRVHIMMNGRVSYSGGAELAITLEKQGYAAFSPKS